MTRDRALRVLSERAGEIRQRFGVRELSIFGSTARDQSKDDSDVDVLVEFDGAATFDRFMDLKFLLEELLEAKVDLVTTRALRDEIRPQVEREAIRVA